MTPSSADPTSGDAPTPDLTGAPPVPAPPGGHAPVYVAPSGPSAGIITVSKLNIALLTLAILSIGAALYLSPLPKAVESGVKGISEAAGIRGSGLPAPSATSTPRARTEPTAAAVAATHRSTSSTRSRTYPSGTSASHRVVTGTGSGGSSSLTGLMNALFRSRSTSTTTSTTPGPRTTSTTTVTATPSTTPPVAAAPQLTKCWQFAWQQDAQVVYASNLSDPYGLDGAAGPYDGDGLACSDLPVDASRAPSTPIGQYVPRAASADTKAAIVGSATAYYGFTEDGLPNDLSKFDALEKSAGKAPSSVGWYQTFDEDYNPDSVTTAWSRGALPVFTWMPMSADPNHVSLSTIISGQQDDYLTKFAGDVVRTNLPVVIRYGHEMNGRWYGWSSGRTDFNNSPEKYKQAWIHIWNIFEKVGANRDAIWLWSPSRIDDLRPSSTNGLTPMTASYPGDKYVDWVGASVYLRHASTGPTYEASFAKTVAALKVLTTKPLFFAEVGAIETDVDAPPTGSPTPPAVDVPAMKAEFIHNTLGAFAADPRIVGFLWNNNINTTEVVGGDPVKTDWRFDANPAAAQQFVDEIASRRFRTGMVALDQ